MSSQRLIKKYPNRRLYDTRISRYITLENVRQLVIANEDFKVVDKRSGRDITRSILLQVISEQEEGGNPIFRTEVLRNIICFYGDSMQSTMSSYLEMSLEFFNEQQSQFRDRLRRLLGANHPLAALRELSQDQLPIWRSVRREFLANLARNNRAVGDGDSPSEPAETGDSNHAVRNRSSD